MIRKDKRHILVEIKNGVDAPDKKPTERTELVEILNHYLIRSYRNLMKGLQKLGEVFKLKFFPILGRLLIVLE